MPPSITNDPWAKFTMPLALKITTKPMPTRP